MNNKKILAVILSAATMLTAAYIPLPAPVGAPAVKSAFVLGVDAATTKTGFVKEGGKWYYYKNGKKVTGLKKISKKYYYFDNSGAMQSGERSIDGFKYYFKTESDGKAPAVTSGSLKLGGKTWYFSSRGRGFISVGNKKGNKAVGMLMNELKFSSVYNDRKKLETAYEYIVSNITYTGLQAPDISKKGWQHKTALETMEKKRGMCYNYASITGLAAKALGFSAKIVSGKGSRIINGQRRSPSTHAWVLIDGKYVVDTNYATGKDDKNYFLKTYDQIKDSVNTTYEEEKKF